MAVCFLETGRGACNGGREGRGLWPQVESGDAPGNAFQKTGEDAWNGLSKTTTRLWRRRGGSGGQQERL